MLQGEHTNLRAVERDDLELIHRWLDDPELMRWWGYGARAASLASVQEWVEQWGVLERGLGHPVAFVIESLDFAALCRNTVERFTPRFQAGGLSLSFRSLVPEALIEVDGLRIEQCLDNLLVNALRYVPRGGHVELELSRLGDRFLATLSDDGPGLPAAELESVQRRREVALAHEAVDASHGGRGAVLGVAAAARALVAGRLSHLLFDNDRERLAWPGERLVEAGLPIDPAERLIELALDSAASITPVEGRAARVLDAGDGVAGLLRW